MDSALALRYLLRRPQVYLIHTQEHGLTGKTSDSSGGSRAGLTGGSKSSVVSGARSVVVFNEEYSRVVQLWNPETVFSPTWYDPGADQARTRLRAIRITSCG